MKTFSPKYLIPFLFLLSITACEDNYVIEGEEQVNISDPIEVESTEVSGRVIDSNNNAVSDAEVMVSYNNEIMTVYTESDGRYAFSLPKDDSRILMQVHSEDFVTSGIDALRLDAVSKQKDVKLLKSEEVGYNGEVSLLSQSTNATLSGQVLLSDGSPAPDIKIVLLDLASFLFSSYDITDENGNYSIASEPFENYLLFAASECDGVEQIAENINLDNQDIDFGVYQSNFSEINQFVLGGTVINCNTGEALVSGRVEIRFDGNSKAYYSNIVDGAYTVLVDNCLDATCYNIRISSPLFEEDLQLECEDITGDLMVVDYEYCEEEIIDLYKGEIRLLIGTDSLIYENAGVEYDPTTDQWLMGGVGDNITEAGAIIFKADGVGIADFIFLQIEDDDLGIYQNYNTSGIPLTIEITEFADYMRGTLSGQLINEVGELSPISGTFDIEIQ